MASIEKTPVANRLQTSKAFYYPRISLGQAENDFLITRQNQNRPTSFYASNLKKTNFDARRDDNRFVPPTKKTPPPVPPRSPKTFNIPTPTTTTPKIKSPERVDSPKGDFDFDTPKQKSTKKTPPPVPKKPTHLRLFSKFGQSNTTPIQNFESPSTTGQNLHMRLFALLLSPTTPLSPRGKNASNRIDNCGSTSKIKKRSLTIFGSTPHLDRISVDTTPTNFDDNNNNFETTEIVEDKNGVEANNSANRRSSTSFRSTRRKSLPLLSKNSTTVTTPTTEIYSSARTSRCSSSFGAEQGSLFSSSNLSPNSPPPPVPKKDYFADKIDNRYRSSSIDLKNRRGSKSIIDQQQQQDEAESVVFFSTISTISSQEADYRLIEKNKPRQRQETNLEQFSEISNRRRVNPSLNAFAVEQSRRTVSVIERNARIIKWLYGCSKN